MGKMVRMEPGTNEKKRKGRRLDPETAAAMGKVKSDAKAAANATKAVGNKARTGQPHSEETKARQRAASLGNTSSVGRVISEAHKAALAAGREAARARKREQNRGN